MDGRVDPSSQYVQKLITRGYESNKESVQRDIMNCMRPVDFITAYSFLKDTVKYLWHRSNAAMFPPDLHRTLFQADKFIVEYGKFDQNITGDLIKFQSGAELPDGNVHELYRYFKVFNAIYGYAFTPLAGDRCLALIEFGNRTINIPINFTAAAYDQLKKNEADEAQQINFLQKHIADLQNEITTMKMQPKPKFGKPTELQQELNTSLTTIVSLRSELNRMEQTHKLIESGKAGEILKIKDLEKEVYELKREVTRLKNTQNTDSSSINFGSFSQKTDFQKENDKLLGENLKLAQTIVELEKLQVSGLKVFTLEKENERLKKTLKEHEPKKTSDFSHQEDIFISKSTQSSQTDDNYLNIQKEIEELRLLNSKLLAQTQKAQFDLAREKTLNLNIIKDQGIAQENLRKAMIENETINKTLMREIQDLKEPGVLTLEGEQEGVSLSAFFPVHKQDVEIQTDFNISYNCINVETQTEPHRVEKTTTYSKFCQTEEYDDKEKIELKTKIIKLQEGYLAATQQTGTGARMGMLTIDLENTRKRVRELEKQLSLPKSFHNSETQTDKYELPDSVLMKNKDLRIENSQLQAKVASCEGRIIELEKEIGGVYKDSRDNFTQTILSESEDVHSFNEDTHLFKYTISPEVESLLEYVQVELAAQRFPEAPKEGEENEKKLLTKTIHSLLKRKHKIIDQEKTINKLNKKYEELNTKFVDLELNKMKWKKRAKEIMKLYASAESTPQRKFKDPEDPDTSVKSKENQQSDISNLGFIVIEPLPVQPELLPVQPELLSVQPELPPVQPKFSISLSSSNESNAFTTEMFSSLFTKLQDMEKKLEANKLEFQVMHDKTEVELKNAVEIALKEKLNGVDLNKVAMSQTSLDELTTETRTILSDINSKRRDMKDKLRTMEERVKILEEEKKRSSLRFDETRIEVDKRITRCSGMFFDLDSKIKKISSSKSKFAKPQIFFEVPKKKEVFVQGIRPEQLETLKCFGGTVDWLEQGVVSFSGKAYNPLFSDEQWELQKHINASLWSSKCIRRFIKGPMF